MLKWQNELKKKCKHARFDDFLMVYGKHVTFTDDVDEGIGIYIKKIIANVNLIRVMQLLISCKYPIRY